MVVIRNRYTAKTLLYVINLTTAPSTDIFLGLRRIDSITQYLPRYLGSYCFYSSICDGSDAVRRIETFDHP